jgi:hypothetical protein
MIKTIFILDTSGSMSDNQIREGMKIISSNVDIYNRKVMAIFFWSGLDQTFLSLVTDLKKLYPLVTTHLIGDGFFTEEELLMVDQVTVVP